MNERACVPLNNSGVVEKIRLQIKSGLMSGWLGLNCSFLLPNTTQEWISTDLSLLQTVTIYPSLLFA